MIGDVLMVFVFLSGALVLFSLFRLRRSFKSIEGLLTGSKPAPPRVMTSATDPEEKALVSFDEKREMFRWEGKFEGNRTTYCFHPRSGYTTLEIVKGNDQLSISSFAKSPSGDDVLSLLPYRIEVNAQGVYSSDLMKDPQEAPLIRELLESYFTHGIKLNYERLSASAYEAVESLLFGYHTFQRFRGYLHKEYPEFIRQIHQYRGKSLLELISPFKAEGRSREELELELKQAVFEENYERAALIKRELRALEAQKPKVSETPGERQPDGAG